MVNYSSNFLLSDGFHYIHPAVRQFVLSVSVFSVFMSFFIFFLLETF